MPAYSLVFVILCCVALFIVSKSQQRIERIRERKRKERDAEEREETSKRKSASKPKPKSTTKANKVGDDGLTKHQRYEKKRKEKYASGELSEAHERRMQKQRERRAAKRAEAADK